MTFGSVGIRCPEHSGRPQGAAKVVRGVQRRSTTNPGLVAKALIGINVAVYLLQLAQGAPITANRGSIYEHGVLVVGGIGSDGQPLGLVEGEWWRLISAAFLHYGPVHLAMNMLVLYLFGPALESVLGSARFLMVYLAAGLAGSAGALVMSPDSATVGASGAIYGVFGAILLLERQGTYVFGGSVLPLLVVNLAITFVVPGISIGGHLGGLAGGALAILVLSRFGQRRVGYSRNDLLGYAGLVAIGLFSVAVAYWKVRGYT